MVQRYYLSKDVWVEKLDNKFQFKVAGEVVSEVETTERLSSSAVKRYFIREIEEYAPSPIEGPTIIMRKLRQIEKRLDKIEEKISLKKKKKSK